MRQLLVHPDTVFDELHARIQRVLISPNYFGVKPWLPEGEFAFDIDRGWKPQHRCEDERVIVLPTVLVMYGAFCFRSRSSAQVKPVQSFVPYYTREIRLIHENMNWLDAEKWRMATPIEAACCIAEWPEVGSVRTLGNFGRHQEFLSAQAYIWRGDVVALDELGSSRHHHLMFVKRDHETDPRTSYITY